jgi:hypothetical protein
MGSEEQEYDCRQQEPVIAVRVAAEIAVPEYGIVAMSIKRPEMLDEFTRGFIESLAKPGAQQEPRKNARKTVNRRLTPRFKPANKKSSTVTRSALAAHALSNRNP